MEQEIIAAGEGTRRSGMAGGVPAMRPSRKRLIAFWIMLVLFLVPHQFVMGSAAYLWPFTIWNGDPEFPTHEIHMLVQGMLLWATTVAAVAQLWRPERQIGAAWQYTLIGILLPVAAATLGMVPPEALPMSFIFSLVGILAFLLHPASFRAKFRPVTAPSPILLGFVVIAFVPLMTYAIDNLTLQITSGAGDGHWALGHWMLMGCYAFITLILGAIAAVKLPGWRLPGWTVGLMAASHGIASFMIPVASALSPLWAAIAISWGLAFIAVVEYEAHSDTALDGA